ncbi:MAG TPA: hypothetical protein VL547_09725 [Dinghuibacter sp.]|uniref:hypothetical protein n=1 Tax=Dinghuibacter sp. TaxID=2024697 RepID=UPI002BA993D8|nr:hypothetical protein [Dinghuibacter sp.]HTJ12294.1 hypothetical protein [Dinghuibacter sp.]
MRASAAWLTTGLTREERSLAIDNTWLKGCPVNEIDRRWLESAIKLLLGFFGSDRRVLIPHHTDFPIQYDRSDQSANKTMRIVAGQMEVDPDSIQVQFFEDEKRKLDAGSFFGDEVFLEGGKYALGHYGGQTVEGQYEIWLNRSLLTQPESMVATLAHEIAHIKLLGEERMDKTDEHLTDLTTVVFGLGVFNANAAFQIIKTATSHGWRKKGYLTQMQWGYALALFAHVRHEQTPAWIDHLTRSIKKDFLQAQGFIRDNPEKIGV